MPAKDHIIISKASENNLKEISLSLPANKLIMVTGLSGSGKSSLVYDVIFREAENRYLGSFSSYARQFMGRMKKPEVEKIEGLSPAIAVNQKSVINNPRSTVGTLTGLYDFLRLIFARLGKSNRPDHFEIDRSLFSFNNPKGACEKCLGLGVEEYIDLDLLISDSSKTLRQGALSITTSSGYIIYSQVTMDVLNQVCQAEGFNVDISWDKLTKKQRDIVLYGSDKIEIPFGKHTLESRMRWSGITARPRETGYYKGVIPVMENILKRDRNKNILRFVRSGKCSLCQGKRLNEKSLSVKWQQKNIADFASLTVLELDESLRKILKPEHRDAVASNLISQILKRTEILEKLGTGYLQINRGSDTLSGGESQRLRFANQVLSDLSGMLYIFDEPSIGLHPVENRKMIEVLKELRDRGNTIIVVEHEDDFIRQADHLIDIGPAAGVNGGEVLINAAIGEIPALQVKSPTRDYLLGKETFEINRHPSNSEEKIHIDDAAEHNLKHIDVDFKLHALNVVTGVSGAGKSTLTEVILSRFLKKQLHGGKDHPGRFDRLRGWEKIKKLVAIDQSPIGRTPRSNPATYTGLFDHIRDLFAALPGSKNRGWSKGRFSFNNKGGRCETCQGAGYRQIGMHFMGQVEILCEECNGRRFNDDTLEVKFKDKNVYDVLEMSVDEALSFFTVQKKLNRTLQTLHRLGLGYVKLGQRSTTLSGGEAQRVKLASELSRPGSSHTLYVLDEPTTGLHNANVKVLLQAMKELVEHENTVILIEHHMGLILSADHIIDLGPGSGKQGGYLLASGPPEAVMQNNKSLTGRAMKAYIKKSREWKIPFSEQVKQKYGLISFKGVKTHNLKNIDVDFPQNKLITITGVSGSGKSSLAFDTLYAEGRNRFLESYSAYVRSRIGMQGAADFDEVHGLTPVLAIDRKGMRINERSTVGTMTGLYELFRLMFARAAKSPDSKQAYSTLFSFNHQQGACDYCEGLGKVMVCDPDKLVTHPEESLLDGAMQGTKTGRFYGDPYGQYVPTLQVAGKKQGVDFSKAWQELIPSSRMLAMFGSGSEVYEVCWRYKRGKRTGTHNFKGKWPGFVNLINEEYKRKHADRRGEGMMNVMRSDICPQCGGARLNEQALSFVLFGKNIAQLSAMSIRELVCFFDEIKKKTLGGDQEKITTELRKEIYRKLMTLCNLGLNYLSIDRASSGLSGGEAQRVRLAAQIDNGLTGMTFVLDEPTVGLHPADTDKLMKMIRDLRNNNNTVVMVEHDKDVINASDHIIELGPGAGKQGGNLIATGAPAEIKKNKQSISGKYLNERLYVDISRKNLQEGLRIKNAGVHNLNIPELHVPVGGIVSLTGVSGSGKSSLMFDVIGASFHSKRPTGCTSISGLEKFDRIMEITQTSISTSKISNPATYLGAFDEIRKLFASTEQASNLQLKVGDFSFNSGKGRCEQCQGQGRIRVSLDFVSDVSLICDECKGRRYKDKVLSCKWNQKNIHEVLRMTVLEALDFYWQERQVIKNLKVLDQVGLGYLQLGQSTDTLSGGEVQRLKIAKELKDQTSGKTLFLFDEPGTGLHFQDIEVLMRLFKGLSERGHSLIIIEHDPDIILQTDWVIDLGPGGGSEGGRVVAEGTPEQIATKDHSLTGRVLRKYLSK
ncbi:MAG: excinuclease ABC subunit UvrA [Bacteroidales bacterium]|nr:excinuclease ABC subunit UvrA [Bacteroidales bacterium]MCF8343009.1 excinuclease ABC subunit UvrA [Bacteroidales bacterium]MCF8350315.1 excinuclease ABC subunit UvrA [Bacteroidales bacterium]MCF8375981.1 excinuclease ABC subunit UvrA [Bacteroidales bacterium]MCF8400469.1 excinuclease ABC subunit UvrA [Bacteroidales bacterium]